MDPRLLMMHQVMLADRPRLEAYDKAIKARIRPDDVVVDVGAGTLILALLALRHGAGHVYAIEAEPELAELAVGIARGNGVADRLTVIQGDARAVRLPAKADLIITEMMGNLGPEEEMAQIIRAVRRRNLKPGGHVIPERLTTFLVPIQFDGEGWGIWDTEIYGNRFEIVADHAPPRAQLHFFARDPMLLGTPVPIADDHFRSGTGRSPQRVTVRIDRSGRLHAIMGFFRADLGTGVELANFPGYPGANWAVWVWPLRHSPVDRGDRIEIDVARPDGGGSGAGNVRNYADWRLDCRIARHA